MLRGPAERVQHVMEIKPEICRLDMGSLNMGDRVFINTPTHLKAMALAIKDAGVTPELEVFETGHLLLAKKFLEDGLVKGRACSRSASASPGASRRRRKR